MEIVPGSYYCGDSFTNIRVESFFYSCGEKTAGHIDGLVCLGWIVCAHYLSSHGWICRCRGYSISLCDSSSSPDGIDRFRIVEPQDTGLTVVLRCYIVLTFVYEVDVYMDLATVS